MNLERLRFKLIACTLMLSACAALQTSSAPVKFSGGVLVNGAGMTLYTFDKDTKEKSTCVGPCATNWPPFRASDADKPGGAYSLIVRDDGSKQWAYEGKPLYLWSKDQKPGDKTGDGVNKIWHVVEEPAQADSSGGGGY